MRIVVRSTDWRLLITPPVASPSDMDEVAEGATAPAHTSAWDDSRSGVEVDRRSLLGRAHASPRSHNHRLVETLGDSEWACTNCVVKQGPYGAITIFYAPPFRVPKGNAIFKPSLVI
jgi:hypothetical protein